jgi:hypothetical protein
MAWGSATLTAEGDQLHGRLRVGRRSMIYAIGALVLLGYLVLCVLIARLA